MQQFLINDCLKGENYRRPCKADKREQACGKDHFATTLHAFGGERSGGTEDNASYPSKDGAHYSPGEQNHADSHANHYSMGHRIFENKPCC
jgi:hypothetical protein